MEIITMQSEAFQLLVEKINDINKVVVQIKTDKMQQEHWLDIQETCQLLKISKRTLQSYRDKGIIGFSQISGKIYFRLTDIETHLAAHYVKPYHKK
jgi:MerR family transcriptional regulator, repressor of the yfmOP operon